MCSSDVLYSNVPNHQEKLESAVKLHSYPPAVQCKVIYNFPPDCSRGAKMITWSIEGTDEGKLLFPFKVYDAMSKFCSVATIQYRL